MASKTANRTLPAFREHQDHSKRAELRSAIGAAPEPYVVARLERCQREMKTPRNGVRILDVGCGRGDTVAWLLSQGWDAWGVDIAPEYLSRGRPYLIRAGFGGDRLRLIGDEGNMPFESGSFDVILSNQVLEHVRDLDAFAEGILGVSRTGAVGVHVFPARWRIVEPHMMMPVVHWIPKGRLRDGAIKAMLRTGAAAPYFSEYGIDERSAIFATFSRDETFYRPLSQIRDIFRTHGFACSVSAPARLKLKGRVPRVARPFVPVLASLYCTVGSVYLETVRTSGAVQA